MTFRGTLRPFQGEAHDRMVERGRILLAMDMGTGKTPTTIAAVETLIGEGKVDSGLVVVPASLKYQWKKQIDKFTDGANVLVVNGTPEERARQYRRIKAGETEYAVLNYEQVVNDWQWVRDLPRDFVVCDEVQAIKSFAAKRSKMIKRLSAEYIFGLSGQPLENRPEDVYSIMQWIDDDVLGRFDIFDKTFIVRDSFGRPKRYKNLPTLHRRLGEAMVRVTRDEVKDQMPAVTEETILIDFDKAGANLYRKIVKDLLNELAKVQGSSFNVMEHYGAGGGSKAQLEQRGRIMSRLTCLRMLCDHPELLHVSADAFDDPDCVAGSIYASALKKANALDSLKASPKLDVTVDLIKSILEADPRNKIVVFAFFKPTLHLLKAATNKVAGSVVYTGDLNAKQKQFAVEKFEGDKTCRLFLSSDAGGVGLDLPNANYLISYDLPWSAGKMDQRNSRIIRLSSEFENVTLINMLMRGSIEERQYAMLEQKRAIASAVIDGKGIEKGGNLSLSLSTLKEFLEETEV